MAERIVVGMSGGVDSSVAAAMLMDQGFEVIGATMLVWTPPGIEMEYADSCCGLSAAEDARRVCQRLGIRHYVLDFKDVFYERIIKNYVEEYRQGRTPNPCIRCNEFIKFDALLQRARALGAERVATGHYARIRFDETRQRWVLLRGADRRKDQSYALYRLSQEQLSRTLFPLGHLHKPQVREAAAALDLPTAGKPDSQETCFVPDNDYPSLLRILAPDTLHPGSFQSPEGEVLGRHEGLAAYTLGQRKRINVGSPVPLYVSQIIPAENIVTIAPAGHPSLERRTVEAAEINWVSIPPPGPAGLDEMSVQARIRYNATDQPATLSTSPSGLGETARIRAVFDLPVRAATPGQSLVCYQGDELLVGGLISG